MCKVIVKLYYARPAIRSAVDLQSSSMIPQVEIEPKTADELVHIMGIGCVVPEHGAPVTNSHKHSPRLSLSTIVMLIRYCIH